MILRGHELIDDDGKYIGTVTPATNEDAVDILQRSEDGNDGRSNFVWVRLSNGDLILGVFPQGDTYEEFTQSRKV